MTRFQFLENAINDENFPDLTSELIKEMIPQIGLRIEFLKKWMKFKPKETSNVSIQICTL